MSRNASVLMIAASLAACGGDELRAPISGPPARFSTPGHSGSSGYAPSGPTPRAIVASVASKPSFELEAPPVAEVGNLCTYRTRKDPVMQGFSDRSGAQWEGEIRVRDVPTMDTKWFSPSDKRVATMVARPRVEVYRVRVDDNCYNAATKTYHACSKVLEADLTQVRGFARAQPRASDRARDPALREEGRRDRGQVAADHAGEHRPALPRVPAGVLRIAAAATAAARRRQEEIAAPARDRGSRRAASPSPNRRALDARPLRRL